MGKDRVPTLLKLTRILFFLDATFWLVFGALGLTRAMTETSDMRLIYSVLMLINAAIMLWLGVTIVRAQNNIFFLAILYMALNLVLTITDQFGWMDVLILLLNLIVLGLLFVTRQQLRMT